jgi:hypothetical protein
MDYTVDSFGLSSVVSRTALNSPSGVHEVDASDASLRRGVLRAMGHTSGSWSTSISIFVAHTLAFTMAAAYIQVVVHGVRNQAFPSLFQAVSHNRCTPAPPKQLCLTLKTDKRTFNTSWFQPEGVTILGTQLQ